MNSRRLEAIHAIALQVLRCDELPRLAPGEDVHVYRRKVPETFLALMDASNRTPRSG
jgi:hypothetical protein